MLSAGSCLEPPSRWQAAQQRQEQAAATFAKPAAEAALHRQTLLRFFDLRFKKSPEGQKRLMAIRAGASNKWVKNGTLMSGTADYGALFIRFNVSGDPKRATAYFKDVDGRLADEFTIQVQ
ncbi:hypothetical protein [Sorangium sp. So ce1151]|uniref:hypothetical protein n=1 Tax=Sorangium sp. So ce1151 TaxID=3133332 RepID=UPI003F63F761